MRLPLNITNTATGFNLANFGRPVITAASQNLFGPTTPDVIVDIEIGPTIQDQILTQLGSLDAAADNVSSQSAFSSVIPGLGQSLNGLINDPAGPITRRWGDLIKFEKSARDYFESFNPASSVFNPSNVGLKPRRWDFAMLFRTALIKLPATFSVASVYRSRAVWIWPTTNSSSTSPLMALTRERSI